MELPGLIIIFILLFYNVNHILLSACIYSSNLYPLDILSIMGSMASVSIWLDSDAFRLYVKLNDRMENRDFHEKFLGPLKVLGFKFDASKVAHALTLSSPEELGLLMRQLDANFTTSPLEKEEILYWLGMDISPQAQKDVQLDIGSAKSTRAY